MFLRVALGIHFNDIKEAIETYNYMSNKYFTHATPTLFNSGTPRPQLSSCFLLAMKDDSIDGIFSTLKDCASRLCFQGKLLDKIELCNFCATHSTDFTMKSMKVYKLVDNCYV